MSWAFKSPSKPPWNGHGDKRRLLDANGVGTGTVLVDLSMLVKFRMLGEVNRDGRLNVTFWPLTVHTEKECRRHTRLWPPWLCTRCVWCKTRMIPFHRRFYARFVRPVACQHCRGPFALDMGAALAVSYSLLVVIMVVCAVVGVRTQRLWPLVIPVASIPVIEFVATLVAPGARLGRGRVRASMKRHSLRKLFRRWLRATRDLAEGKESSI